MYLSMIGICYVSRGTLCQIYRANTCILMLLVFYYNIILYSVNFYITKNNLHITCRHLYLGFHAMEKAKTLKNIYTRT